MPFVLPVKLAEHVVELPLPLSVQLVLVGDAPAPLAVRLTVPAGAVAAGDVSVTVIVQVLATPTTALGQVTLVVVECADTVIEPLPGPLPAWVASPP